MLAVVVSRADDASLNVGEQLRELVDWRTQSDTGRSDGDGGGIVYRHDGVAIREFDDRHLDLVRPAEAFEDPDLLVFASKHAGDTGRLLTAHHTGNFGPADHGGRDGELARACPNAHDRVLESLRTHAPEDYRVGMEATHHGPSQVGAPSMFVEVGSGPEQWRDPEAARAVARSILDLRNVSPDRPPEEWSGAVSRSAATDARSGQTDRLGETAGSGETDRTGQIDRGDETDHTRHVVGFGGGHYAPRFERLLEETDWAVGHVAPDWGLEALGDPGSVPARDVVAQAFERSRAQYALVDGAHPAVVDAIEELGYRPVSETWLRETDGVALPLVDALEDAIAPVEAGLRFGAARPGSSGGVSIVSLPDGLLEAALAVDAAGVERAVAERTVAFVTDENGTTVVGPVALPDSTDSDAIVGALLDVLRTGYDEVERTDDVVVARRERFDPDRAHTLGVPEGPAFGRLAAGEPVEVDGREIDPAVVHTIEEERFEL